MSIDLSEIDNEIIDALDEKEEMGENTQITPIHKDIAIFYNSVNIAVGKQGSGKTLLFMRELLKIDALNVCHLLIYVTPSGSIDDDTFSFISKKFKNLPVLTVSHDDIEEVVDGLIYYKTFYNEMMKNGKINKLVPEQKKLLLEALYLKSFTKEGTSKRLHTLILFDDIACSNLFKKDESYFNKLVYRCRHINCIFMYGVQKFKGVSMSVKSQATSLFIYPGFNPHEISYIYHNTTIKDFDYNNFKKLYKLVKKDQCLYCNSVSDEIKIIDMSHLRKNLSFSFPETDFSSDSELSEEF